MPDLSRSYWRKIVCKNITEDMKGGLSCGLQAGCPPSLLPQEGCYPCAVLHGPSPPHQPAPDLVPQDLELHQPKAGTAVFLGGQRVKEVKAARKGRGVQRQSYQIPATGVEKSLDTLGLSSFSPNLPLYPAASTK